MDKKKITLCLSIIIILIVLTITVIIVNNEKIIIKGNFNNKLLEQYNNNLNIIEKNLDYITYGKPEDSIRWYKFKYENIDENYLNLINMIIKDIRIFYAFSTSNGEIYYSNANYISKFQGIDKISKRKFNEKIAGYDLSNNDYLSNFKKYNDFFLNDSYKEYIELRLLLDPLITFSDTINNAKVKDYKELLINEYNKSLFLKNITEYLKKYYDSLKG